uniref:Ig-like domain-containing protein n=1 Tax=Fundulus heteroclitus TaxID=8078 RepID=A0A3Q2QR28_FUNHE
MSITLLAPLFLLVCDLLSGDQEEVKVTGGAESVVLPCRTSPNLHAKTSVYWTRSEPEFNTVHVFSNKSKDQNKEDSLYRGRTKLNEDLLRTGDLSLTLSYPTERDSGTYICTVYRDKDILRWKVVLKHAKGQRKSKFSLFFHRNISILGHSSPGTPGSFDHLCRSFISFPAPSHLR